MESAESKAVPGQRMSRLACWSLLCWMVATALGFVSFYLDHYAPYRELGGYPKDKIESHLLLLAVLLASAGIAFALSAMVSLRRSRGKIKGLLLAVTGMVLDLVTMIVFGGTLFMKGLIASMPT